MPVVAWLSQRAVAIGGEDMSPPEAATIARITAGADVIGFGEVGHGNREPLDYRNRLVRHLVEHGGLTAVALESGLADTRPVGDYVLGGPGDAAAVVRDSLSWGFGALQANVDLVRWLRDWNERHPRRQVRLYGIDASVKLDMRGPPELDANTILRDLDAVLVRTVPAQSLGVRRGLAPFQRRFTSSAVRALDADGRRQLEGALAAVAPLVARERTAIVGASTPGDYDWAAREASDAPQLVAILANWTVAFDVPKLTALIRDRDRVMADNVGWVLAREGRGGRVLVFAANGHVTAAAMVGSIMRQFPEQPPVMGTLLRQRLGGRYRVILSASAFGRAAGDSAIGGVDRAFLAAGRGGALASLRAAPGWWRQPQGFAQGPARVDDAVPALAADGLVFFDRVTPAPTSRARP